MNYFQPSMKLRSKTREGAKVKKKYHKPATPCERLLAHPCVAEAVKESLRTEQSRGWTAGVVAPHPGRPGCPGGTEFGGVGDGQERESLEEFLAGLPELWRQGKARPTHRESAPGPREGLADAPGGSLREGVAGDPAVAAGGAGRHGQSLLAQLLDKGSIRVSSPRGSCGPCNGEVRDWRRVMAQTLVHACLDGKKATGNPVVVGAEQNG